MRLTLFMIASMFGATLLFACGASPAATPVPPDTPTPAPSPTPTAAPISPTVAPEPVSVSVPHRGYNVRGNEDAPITIFDFSDFQ